MRFPLGGGARARLVWSVSSAAVVLALAPSVFARSGGIAVDSCFGCHGDGSAPPDLTLTANPETFEPGDTVTFTLTVENPSMDVAGTFITTVGIGSLEPLAGEGLSLSAQGLTHSQPKTATNGAVTFRFAWRAPTTPGGVDFHVLALAANGNNSVTGDSPGSGAFQWAFGCEGRAFYVDLDRDGYGSERLGVRLGCDGDPAPEGYALMDGDCDENRELVHPGAVEVCNRRDDDCNGEIDENAPPVNLWPDGDGDGFYTSAIGTPQVGCGDVAGYAAVGGDCDDKDATIHPGATEICNARDDNCDGEVDDHVRPQCGTGWCRRYSATCDPADCEPGPPAVETCNAFDDDCDGENDNDACPVSMLCWNNECIENPQAATGGDAGASGIGGSPTLPDQPMDAGAMSSSGGSCLVSTPPPASTPPSDDGSFAEPGPPVVAGEASAGVGPASGVATGVEETANPATNVVPNEVNSGSSGEAGCSVSSLAASQAENNRAAFAGMFLLACCAFARRRLVKAAKGLSALRRRNRIHYSRSIPCDHH